MGVKGLGLKEQILVAAVRGTDGDCTKTFTMEDLVVWAWELDKKAWGLRGFEEKHPDSDKLQKDMGKRGRGQEGIVDMGWVERVGRRVYRLTAAGLAVYASLGTSDPIFQEKAGRQLEAEVRRIFEHPVFKDWLKDHSRPRYFREAGHFWGIAPGTPARAVRVRVNGIDETLRAATALLNARGVEEIGSDRRGKVLFDRTDIERCVEFQATLKQRFARELRVLDPSFAS